MLEISGSKHGPDWGLAEDNLWTFCYNRVRSFLWYFCIYEVLLNIDRLKLFNWRVCLKINKYTWSLTKYMTATVADLHRKTQHPLLTWWWIALQESPGNREVSTLVTNVCFVRDNKAHISDSATFLVFFANVFVISTLTQQVNNMNILTCH